MAKITWNGAPAIELKGDKSFLGTMLFINGADYVEITNSRGKVQVQIDDKVLFGLTRKTLFRCEAFGVHTKERSYVIGFKKKNEDARLIFKILKENGLKCTLH